MLLHDPADFTAAPPADTGSPRPATTPSAAATATAATTATTAWCRGVREVEAESVAHLIAAGAGLDTAGYTFAYVAGWAASTGDADAALRAAGTRVLATARRVLDAHTPSWPRPSPGRPSSWPPPPTPWRPGRGRRRPHRRRRRRRLRTADPHRPAAGAAAGRHRRRG